MIFVFQCAFRSLKCKTMQGEENKSHYFAWCYFSKIVMEYHDKKQIVSQPTSNKPYSNVPRPCDF